MKDLKGLIRLHKLQVDEHRRQLADLRAMEERLRGERQRLEEQIVEEQRVAASSVVMSMTYPAYARQMRLRAENLGQSIAHIQREIDKVSDALADAFQELKRYELAQEERERKAKAERARRETQTFDEIAATRFQRANGQPDSE